MTSMLLTLRYARDCTSDLRMADIAGANGGRTGAKGCAPFTLPVQPPQSARGLAVAQGDVLLLRVLRRGLLDHRPHDRLVGGDPVADRVPFAAVPLQELHRAAALVVEARDPERLHQSGRTELLQALVVDVQVLERPAHLLAGDRLALAEFRLRVADRLRGDDAGHDAARVVDRADARLVVQVTVTLA